MVANDVSKKGLGFNRNFNEVIIINKKGKNKKLKKFKKIYCINNCQKIMNSFFRY